MILKKYIVFPNEQAGVLLSDNDLPADFAL